MSLVSPTEFADPKDSPDKVIKSTVLIATVQEDEPVVTRKELWSYYRASSRREFCALHSPGRSLLQRRQRTPSFHLVSFFISIPSYRESVLSVIPRHCSKASLLPLATIQPLVQARPVFLVLPRDNVSSLGWVVPNPLRVSYSLRMALALRS